MIDETAAAAVEYVLVLAVTVGLLVGLVKLAGDAWLGAYVEKAARTFLIELDAGDAAGVWDRVRSF